MLPADTKRAALTEFARDVVAERSRVAEHPAFARVLEAGYSRAQALDVVLGVAKESGTNRGWQD